MTDEDLQRIDDVIDELRARWVENPELRLGQLLVNVVNPSEPCPEIFYIEDRQLFWKLELY